MNLSSHHQELDEEGEGRCSVPMWTYPGMPAGFCDQAAFGRRPPCDEYRDAAGEIRRTDGKYNGYVPALACTMHGGPDGRHHV